MDEVPLLSGRTALQCYEDFMLSFVNKFESFIGSVIEEISIGLGPSGELRYCIVLMSFITLFLFKLWSYCWNIIMKPLHYFLSAGILLILLVMVDGNSLALVNSSAMISTCRCKVSFILWCKLSCFSILKIVLLSGWRTWSWLHAEKESLNGGTEGRRMLAVTTAFHQGCPFLKRDRKAFYLIMVVSSWYVCFIC